MLDAGAPRRLESFVNGEWQAGQGDGQPLLDAATGAVHAHVGSQGLDFAGALEFAHDRGAALRAMTIHERAQMLKDLALYLNGHKDALYVESFRTGATMADSQIDIDGGIATLFAYSSKGRRELPNTAVMIEGDVEPLSRDNSFFGQHILTPLRGAAIHLNAFNFPVWGMLEKLAPTWLAGMPAIVKPASQTAYLSELAVRHMAESGILPAGALQLICGGVGDLLAHVTGQDVVTFTGSASTGRMLKTTPAIVANSTRFTMEADSLNCSILGPDAGAGTVEFDLFVAEVAREMTTKAGQKCTAIRRVIVPRQHIDAVAGALGSRLENTAVGLPQAETTRMGALASLHQRKEVRARIVAMRVDAEIVSGDPDDVRLTSGDAQAGAYLNPVLLHCARPFEATAVHDVEAGRNVDAL